jgi:hypothetical protein
MSAVVFTKGRKRLSIKQSVFAVPISLSCIQEDFYMQLKKLILFLPALFVLASYCRAGDIPRINFGPNALYDEHCNYEKTEPETEAFALPDGKYKFKVGKYAGKQLRLWGLAEEALVNNDRVAAELLKYCVRGNGTGPSILNNDGVHLLGAAAYFDSDIARDIASYLINERGWSVDCMFRVPRGVHTPLAATAEADILKNAEFFVKHKANPYTIIYDDDINGNYRELTVLEFAREKNPRIYNFLKTVKRAAALLQDAFYKAVNYALNDKNELLRLEEKLKSNGIVSDFTRALDGNSPLRSGYNRL